MRIFLVSLVVLYGVIFNSYELTHFEVAIYHGKQLPIVRNFRYFRLLTGINTATVNTTPGTENNQLFPLDIVQGVELLSPCFTHFKEYALWGAWVV